jgi:glutamyl-tRNA synthetase
MVRTRFAPSPTGYMHVGNLRTALYTYLLTKSMNGKFILRIEDTDQERFVEGSVDVIYNTLKDTGLIWDEGPDIGGPVGPYIQSERRGLYKEYTQKLVDLDGAYYCFCEKERLDELRKIHEASGIPHKYDGHCKKFSKAEAFSRIAAGEPYVIRQKMPQEGTTTFHDIVFGDITVENSTLDDNILLKSDGLPTYNFANVIDDHLMGITHIVRGSEYLSSSPRYNLLYKSFGWEVPEYIHCSPVMKNSTEKLSKRNGDASYQDLTLKGYLKDAIMNYIALLGWSPKGEREIFSLSELIEQFDVSGISKSPAIFDVNKLNWINGEYIRALSLDEFHQKALPWIKQAVKSDADTQVIAAVLQPRTEKLSDIPEQLDFIDTLPEYGTELYVHKKMKSDEASSLSALNAVLPILEAIPDTEWKQENIHSAVFELIAKLEAKNGVILWPIRVALSGKQFTPGGGIEICCILGKSKSIARIKKGIELLEVL